MNQDSDKFSIDDLARQLADTVPENLRTMGDDLHRGFKALLKSGFERMDLVSREEFDTQKAVLARTREKLESLETKLAALEQAISNRD
jgi:BMFP domain-containing protein YqiC